MLRLGAPGVIAEAIVDTIHFRGQRARAGDPAPVRRPVYVRADELDDAWFPLVAPMPVRADHRKCIPVDVPTRVTHVP